MSFTPIASPAPGIQSVLAETPLAGVALTAGTPTFLSWTAPNDGQNHQVVVIAELNVGGTAQTGGAVGIGFTLPSGNVVASGTQLFAGGLGPNTQTQAFLGKTVAPGSTTTISQSSGQSAGGPSTLYCQLIGS